MPSEAPNCNVASLTGGCCHDLCEYLVVEQDPSCETTWSPECVELACGANGVCGGSACAGECLSTSAFCATDAPTSVPSESLEPSLEPSQEPSFVRGRGRGRRPDNDSEEDDEGNNIFVRRRQRQRGN